MGQVEKIHFQKVNTNLFLQHPKKKKRLKHPQVVASTHTRHPYRQCGCIIYIHHVHGMYVCSQQNIPTSPHNVT